MSLTVDRDLMYRETLLSPLRSSADYLPKMGGNTSVDLAGFAGLYGADPLYHWIGFDSPLMFAAHKAAGGMTSIYRQLGIGCERLFRLVLQDELALSEEQIKWSYSVPSENRKRGSSSSSNERTLSLDGRISIADVGDRESSDRIKKWIDKQRGKLGALFSEL